jgi:hypothetical protein
VKRQKYAKILGGLFALLSSAVPLFAQVTFWVDMGGGLDTRAASPGDTFTAKLMLTVGASGVSSYGVSVMLDPAELTLNGSPACANFSPLPGGLLPFQPPTEPFNPSGPVYNFNAGTLGNGPVSKTFEIGTINLKVVTPISDGFPDVTLGFFSFLDGLFDNLGGSPAPTFVPGYVAAITAHVPPSISSITPQTDGTMILSLSGTPNSTNRLWVTTDLTPPLVWSPVSTNVAAPDGTWQYNDSGAVGWPTRYYRVSMP